VPTLREQGVPLDASAWFAMYGSSTMSKDAALRLSRAVATAVRDGDFAAKLTALGLEPIGSSPEQLAAVQAADFAKWEKPVQASGFTAD
jgi:tripartite-type tricarboxylate transporter receptor subunit TctC